MATSECDYCGNEFYWNWEEAFDKFGFNDGDGQIETWQVEDVLIDAGYTVKKLKWGLHNLLITSIKKNGVEQIPTSANVGYDEPREYLPVEIVELLDLKFSSSDDDEKAGVTS